MNRTFYPYRGLDFITRRYYTLGELYEASMQQPTGEFGRYAPYGNNFKLDDLVSGAALPHEPWMDDEGIKTLMTQYVFPRFWESFIVFSDEVDKDQACDITTEEFKKVFQNVGYQIINWLRDTQLKYTKELSIYFDIENKLMDQVQTNTIARANDTPQIPDTGMLDDDPYVSSVAQTTQYSDVGTPIERLKQVRNNIRDAFSAWADEFRKFVIYA